jgi:hypothetical protein
MTVRAVATAMRFSPVANLIGWLIIVAETVR